MSDDKLPSERLRGRVEYWKQTISVQMHFNDLCIRTRWLGLTAVATLLAAAGVSARANIEFALPHFDAKISLPSVLLLSSIVILVALCMLDHMYYYRLLIASVRHAEEIEPALLTDLGIDGDGMTNYLSKSVSRRSAALASWLFYILTGTVLAAGLYLSLKR
jgi:hypothetical protein